MRSLEQRGNEGWGEGWDGSTCGSILGSGCWVVLAVLGRSLVELSSTLGVRLKNRPPLFTVKNSVRFPSRRLQAGNEWLYRSWLDRLVGMTRRLINVTNTQGPIRCTSWVGARICVWEIGCLALFHSVSINSNRHSVMGNRKVSSPLTGNGEAAILCYVGMYVCIGGEGRRRGGGGTKWELFPVMVQVHVFIKPPSRWGGRWGRKNLTLCSNWLYTSLY